MGIKNLSLLELFGQLFQTVKGFRLVPNIEMETLKPSVSIFSKFQNNRRDDQKWFIFRAFLDRFPFFLIKNLLWKKSEVKLIKTF